MPESAISARSAWSGTPILDQKYDPFLDAIKRTISDFGGGEAGWAGWLAGLAGLGLGWSMISGHWSYIVVKIIINKSN